MDFGVENLTVTNGVASVDLSKLDDAQLVAARAELDAAEEARGLALAAAAGGLVGVAVGTPFVRDQLLSTAEAGSQLYIDVINGINQKRNKRTSIPVLTADEYAEQASDWLTASRVDATTALPATDNRPLILVPRLNRAITTEENLEAWSAASDRGHWSGRTDFLRNWSANQLSGFDPSQEDEVTFAIVPTAYDLERQGVVVEQTKALEAMQATRPEVGVTPIFVGAILARRYKGRGRIWRDSYVKDITLTPAKVGSNACVPVAYVYGDGTARVDAALARDAGAAARLQVR